MADEPTYYWDACILLEHFREERVAPTKLRAIQRLLTENKEKKNRIITSIISHVEVLPKKLTAADATKEEKYWGYYDDRYFIDIELSRNIINLARDIKDYYFVPADPTRSIPGKMMSTGDAIHVATAIIYKVDEFHTRDGNKKHGNVPLLGLPDANGKIAGQWPLKIISPEDDQADLLDAPSHKPSDS
jgi:PIN domain